MGGWQRACARMSYDGTLLLQRYAGRYSPDAIANLILRLAYVISGQNTQNVVHPPMPEESGSWLLRISTSIKECPIRASGLERNRGEEIMPNTVAAPATSESQHPLGSSSTSSKRRHARLHWYNTTGRAAHW